MFPVVISLCTVCGRMMRGSWDVTCFCAASWQMTWPAPPHVVVVVVVVVMTSPSGAAYIGGQMFRRDEEFHQTFTHLWCQSNHWSNAGVLLPIFGRATVNVQPLTWPAPSHRPAPSHILWPTNFIACTVTDQLQMTLRSTYPYQVPFCKNTRYGRDFVPYCISKKY